MTSFTEPRATSITAELAALLRSRPISAADRRAAALYTLDAVANAIGGLATPQGQIVASWTKDRPMDTGRAAFVMGALTHILEVDDLHKASVVHPGCAVVPAAWAIASKTGASGPDFLNAVLWGFEAACRVGMAVGPGHYKIWHNTATCGPFGSAAAAGRLLSLDDAALVNAFGNAGTQSAGLWEFLETGAMSKHLHAGRAAEAGLVAAELAQLCFTGPASILEGSRGFFAATCPDADPAQVLASPDHRWQVHETSIKPWPSCRHTHPAIDAAQEIREQMLAQTHTVEAISDIKIDTYNAALMLCNKASPKTEYAAKFSLQHTVAAALAEPVIELSSFDQGARNRLASLREKINLALAPDLEAAYPQRWGAAVRVRLSDGSDIRVARTDALGDPEYPLIEAQVIEKALGLMRHGGVADPKTLADAILALPEGGALPDLPLPA